MARKTREQKLREEIDNLENVLESLDHPDMEHIANLYFNNKGEYFLNCKTYRGKKYVRLGLQAIDAADPSERMPPESEQAAKNDNGDLTHKYIPYPDDQMKKEGLEIVETLTKAQAIKRFEKSLEAKKTELDQMVNGDINIINNINTRAAKKAVKVN